MFTAKVETASYNPLMGEFYGVEIGGLWYSIPYREGDIQKIKAGDEIEFMTNRDGTVTIFEPHPQVGVERKP
jgi:hypothetical protein